MKCYEANTGHNVDLLLQFVSVKLIISHILHNPQKYNLFIYVSWLSSVTFICICEIDCGFNLINVLQKFAFYKRVLCIESFIIETLHL